MKKSNKSTRKARTSKPTSAELKARTLKLFGGKCEKWLPLYHRLLARLTHLPQLEALPGRTSIAFVMVDSPSVRSCPALVKVAASGLLMGLALPAPGLKSPRLKPAPARGPKGVSHWVSLTEAADIDAELLSWLRVALAGVRRSKR